MKSRAIVFVALVLLVAPFSFMKHGRHLHRHQVGLDHQHQPVFENPPAAEPESPLDQLGR
jgi:hypothetical protein